MQTEQSRDLWYGTSGPRHADIVIVGEAWGAEEANRERPFVGASGNELNRMLAESGIDRMSCLVTNTIAARPQNNEAWRFFSPKAEAQTSLRGQHPEAFAIAELKRLYDQINSFPRKLIIAVGNYALWALTDCSSPVRPSPETQGRVTPGGITKWRGSMWYMLKDYNSLEYSTTKLLPIIHPAAIMRQWDLRAVTVHDLKARVPLALRNDWRPNPKPVFLAPPTLQQFRSRIKSWLAQANAGNKIRLAEDIETMRGFITCVGLTDSTSFAMCVPFIDKRDGELVSFWSPEDEAEVISLLRQINSHPNILIEGQNFIYDTQYFQHWLGVTPRLSFDTMLAQNVMFPGTPKGLDYLSSLYCKYYWYWKDDGKEWDLKGDPKQLWLYNCQDLVNTWECANVQRTLLQHYNMQEQMNFKMQINESCLRKMSRGMRFDTSRRVHLSMELSTALGALEQEILSIIPQDMVPEGTIKGKKSAAWYKSPKQTKAILHDILGLPVIMNRKTGRPTSGKEGRNEWLKRYPEWSGLLTRLGTLESADTARTVINMSLDSDSRIRCSFNPGGTETHRLSSSTNVFGRGTNLQNLSTGDEDD
jgi:uracil-DNA glycosylase family 4